MNKSLTITTFLMKPSLSTQMEVISSPLQLPILVDIHLVAKLGFHMYIFQHWSKL